MDLNVVIYYFWTVFDKTDHSSRKLGQRSQPGVMPSAQCRFIVFDTYLLFFLVPYSKRTKRLSKVKRKTSAAFRAIIEKTIIL